MTLPDLLDQTTSILLESISGSHAHGTAIEESNTDIKGVSLKVSTLRLHFTSMKMVTNLTVRNIDNIEIG